MPKRFLYLSEHGAALLVTRHGHDTLKTLRTLVEGNIEHVTAHPIVTGFTADVWINDEGLFEATFTINPIASLFAHQPLVGPAVLTRTDLDGNTTSLTADDLRTLTNRGLLIDDNNGDGYTPEQAVAIRSRS